MEELTISKALYRATLAYPYYANSACEGFITVPGGRRVMRRYRLGLSVREFHEYLNRCGFMYKKADGKWYEETRV